MGANRKRTAEEAELFDKIDKLKRRRTETSKTMQETVAALLRRGVNESDFELASAARTSIAWRVELDKFDKEISDLQSKYESMRSSP
jgi:hypothetical protein